MYELFRLQIVGKIKKRHAVKYQNPLPSVRTCRPLKDTIRYVKSIGVTFRLYHIAAVRLWATVDGL